MTEEGGNLGKFLDILVYGRKIQFHDNWEEYDAEMKTKDATAVAYMVTGEPERGLLMMKDDEVFIQTVVLAEKLL